MLCFSANCWARRAEGGQFAEGRADMIYDMRIYDLVPGGLAEYRAAVEEVGHCLEWP